MPATGATKISSFLIRTIGSGAEPATEAYCVGSRTYTGSDYLRTAARKIPSCRELCRFLKFCPAQPKTRRRFLYFLRDLSRSAKMRLSGAGIGRDFAFSFQALFLQSGIAASRMYHAPLLRVLSRLRHLPRNFTRGISWRGFSCSPQLATPNF